MKTTKIILFVFSCILFSCDSGKTTLYLESPGKQASVNIGVDNQNEDQLFFSINYLGEEIVNKSSISLSFKDQADLGKNLKIISVDKIEINETWERVWGKSKKVLNHCFEATVGLKETVSPYRIFNLVARAYNDGIAFRYQIPEQANIDSFYVNKEMTSFSFSEDYEVWTSVQPGFRTQQERSYIKTTLSKLKTRDILVTPLLLKLNKGWGALLEANLTDWAGMFLTSGKDSSKTVQTLLSPLPGNPNIAVASKAPRYSPWRVLMLGRRPGDLLESNLIHNLNEPCKLEDVSWIVPGKSAWDCWWCGGYAPKAGFKLGYNTASMKYFIDLASEMGWEYQLVDWLWYKSVDKKYQPYPDGDITKAVPEIDIHQLLEYAKSKNVKLLVWAHWQHAEQQLEKAFPLYEEWGIAGLKIDFMSRNDQEMVRLYHRFISTAAEHKLTVDFHGAYMPTGIDRTYPNLLTREGVIGNEYNKWGKQVSPEHCVTIPFTRMLGGSMDFTPGGFNHAPFGTFTPSGMDTENPRVQGTRCFQLAMPVIYESGLTVFCDSPDNYRGAEGVDFYKVVPTTWDETRVIDGYPGEFIVIARKNGNDWFLGAMTNDQKRTVSIPLDFLGEGSYQATIYSDAADADQHPDKVDQMNKGVSRIDTLKAVMSHGGGFAVHIYGLR